MANTAWYGDDRATRKALRVDWDRVTLISINMALWAAIVLTAKIVFF